MDNWINSKHLINAADLEIKNFLTEALHDVTQVDVYVTSNQWSKAEAWRQKFSDLASVQLCITIIIYYFCWINEDRELSFVYFQKCCKLLPYIFSS